MSTTPPPGDNGRTVRPPETEAETRLETRGFPLGTQNALPVGTRLGEFEIKGLVGTGGFGIVYLAYDHSLQRQVALKEYMPSELAGRDAGATVGVKSERYMETFQAGLRSFVNEARLLAQFDHPSLVKVYRFWESNGTAYMVMPFYRGQTLKQTLAGMEEPPGEAWLKGILAQLLEALSVIHQDNCLHRDISPDNILILPDGRPLLLDFGAARRVIGSMTQTFTVILKPGYAPIEQYADVVTMKQGPWTDVYAVGAVAYFAVTGRPPIAAVARMIEDPLVPLSTEKAGLYDAGFLKGIDRALAIKPEDRPQSVEELRVTLGLHGRPVDQEIPDETTKLILEKNGDSPVTSGSVRSKFYIAAFITFIAVIGGAFYVLSDKQVDSAKAPSAASAPRDSTVSGAIPRIAEEKKFDPLEALDEIFDARDPNHAIIVSTEKAQARIGKDPLRFKIRSAKGGFVYVLMAGTNRSDFFLLFPNAVDKNNLIKPGQQLDLPRPKWKLVAEGPPGTDHFVVIVSDHPRNFSAAGLEIVDSFATFPLEQAGRLYRNYSGSTPLFAGNAICPDSVPDCSQSYAAAVFSIEEI